VECGLKLKKKNFPRHLSLQKQATLRVRDLPRRANIGNHHTFGHRNRLGVGVPLCQTQIEMSAI